jgi:hypothetical protein
MVRTSENFEITLGQKLFAISMCLPTAVSLITNAFPRGKWRNTAFAMNGMGQPLGYALGLVLGGIFADMVGWIWQKPDGHNGQTKADHRHHIVCPSIRRDSDKKWTRQLLEDID